MARGERSHVDRSKSRIPRHGDDAGQATIAHPPCAFDEPDNFPFVPNLGTATRCLSAHTLRRILVLAAQLHGCADLPQGPPDLHGPIGFVHALVGEHERIPVVDQIEGNLVRLHHRKDRGDVFPTPIPILAGPRLLAFPCLGASISLEGVADAAHRVHMGERRFFTPAHTLPALIPFLGDSPCGRPVRTAPDVLEAERAHLGRDQPIAPALAHAVKFDGDLNHDASFPADLSPPLQDRADWCRRLGPSAHPSKRLWP